MSIIPLSTKVYEKSEPLTAEDIAEFIYFCCSLPSHINLNMVELMPVCQAASAIAVHREH